MEYDQRESRPVRATFLGFPVYEAIVSFEGNRPSRFYLSLYNRGDAGPMTYENFEKLVDSFNAAVTEWTGEKGEEQDGRLASGMMLKANFRVSGPLAFTLIGLLTTLVMAMLITAGVWAPARQASRINPVDALRYE